MSRPPVQGERLRFGQPTFAAPRRRRASTPPATVTAPADFDRLAARRAANRSDPDDTSTPAVPDPAGLERLAARRAEHSHPAAPPDEEQP